MERFGNILGHIIGIIIIIWAIDYTIGLIHSMISFTKRNCRDDDDDDND